MVILMLSPLLAVVAILAVPAYAIYRAYEYKEFKFEVNKRLEWNNRKKANYLIVQSSIFTSN